MMTRLRWTLDELLEAHRWHRTASPRAWLYRIRSAWSEAGRWTGPLQSVDIGGDLVFQVPIDVRVYVDDVGDLVIEHPAASR